jgi:hypothetical protein
MAGAALWISIPWTADMKQKSRSSGCQQGSSSVTRFKERRLMCPVRELFKFVPSLTRIRSIRAGCRLQPVNSRDVCFPWAMVGGSCWIPQCRQDGLPKRPRISRSLDRVRGRFGVCTIRGFLGVKRVDARTESAAREVDSSAEAFIRQRFAVPDRSRLTRLRNRSPYGVADGSTRGTASSVPCGELG